VSGETVRTSKVLKFNLEQGAITTGVNAAEPAPDIYQQILAGLGITQSRLDNLLAAQDENTPALSVKSGTWSPKLFGGNSPDCITSAAGWYIKTGNIVRVVCRLEGNFYNLGEEGTVIPLSGFAEVAGTPVESECTDVRVWSDCNSYAGEEFNAAPVIARSSAWGHYFMIPSNMQTADDDGKICVIQFEYISATAASAAAIPELVDIRTGYDGTLYASAGEAVRKQIKKAMSNGGGGSGTAGGTGDGLTQEEKNVILTLFKNIAYTSDMSNTVKSLETLWSGGGGNDDPPEDLPDPVVAYEVINNLTNVTNSNKATTASGYYSATLTVEDGYVMNVTITMGGMDITDSVYTEDGTILIPEVTGDIVITATAELAPIPVLYQLSNAPRTVNADLYEDTGLTFGSSTANGYTDNWTSCVDVIATTLSKHAFCVATSDNTRCIGFTTNGAGTGQIYVCNNSSVTILNNDEKRYKFVITHAANADKKATVHRIVDGVVVSTEVSASYGAFNNSVYAANLFVGGKTAAEFVGTFNEFTIYNKVLSDAHIAEFLGVA
jgi:hypothetical protein